MSSLISAAYSEGLNLGKGERCYALGASLRSILQIRKEGALILSRDPAEGSLPWAYIPVKALRMSKVLIDE